jgi:hypothetical protein
MFKPDCLDILDIVFRIDNYKDGKDEVMKVALQSTNLDYRPNDYNVFTLLLARLAESRDTFQAALSELSKEVCS